MKFKVYHTNGYLYGQNWTQDKESPTTYEIIADNEAQARERFENITMVKVHQQKITRIEPCSE